MAEPIEPPVTLSEESSSAMEVFNSVKVSLADLCAKATAQYAHKSYGEAADLYARAAELQAELNGEMSPENAEILFLYGRALYQVGVSKSDVLGGRVGGEKKKPNGAAKLKKEVGAKEESKSDLEKVTEEGDATIAEQNGGELKTEGDDAKKPLFQFTGDENFEDSDDDNAEDEEGDGEAEEEEEDDFAAAFEALDLSCVLYKKRLEEPEEGDGKGKAVGDSPMTKHYKERLAEAYDLMAEISLENERFPAAVTDFQSALTMKQELYPEESQLVAEAHYKLSLALEFASITRAQEDGEDPKQTTDETDVDQAMRDEAVKELEAAINSTKSRLQNQEVELASSSSPDDNDITRTQIAEVKEILADLETRLVDLRGPPVDVKDILYGSSSGDNPGGILGATLGESPADAAARIEEAKKTANDLTGLIRRKKTAKAADESTPEPSVSNHGTNGKRKAEDDVEDSDNAKKTKVEESVPEA